MVISYFDMDGIGANEEYVPVTFVVPSFSIGRDIVVRSAEGDTLTEITAGSVAHLPLWAAVELRRGGYVTVHTPSSYALQTFREFKNDPLAPSLYAKSPYFYSAGLTLCTLVGNATSTGAMSAEGTRLAAQLFRLYQLRYLKVLLAAAKKGFDLTDIRDKLVESERFLLDAFLRGKSEERRWYTSTV